MKIDPHDLVDGNVKVTSLPVIFDRITEVINKPLSSFKDIANVISEDQGLTASLLRIANSAFYGFPSKIETVSDAVRLIGIQQVRDLVFATSVRRLFRPSPKDLIDIESFWRHSIACGILARILATLRHEGNVERYFVAGIIHDIGRLIIFTKIPDISRRVLLTYKSSDKLLYIVEREILGFDHAEVGNLLLKKWKLPIRLQEMVANHHNPSRSSDYSMEASIIHVSDIIAHAMQFGSSGEQYVPQLNTQAWAKIEFTKGNLSRIFKLADMQFSAVIESINN